MASSLHFWNRSILPPVMDRVMARGMFARLRSEATAPAHGKVLEVGIGSGLNLGYYPRSLESVVGVDPSMPLLQRAHRRAAWMAFPVHLRQGTAERLPITDQSIDVAVSTWTLCSVEDPAQALAEIRRVLKPGGLFCFCEHALCPDHRTAAWQRRLTPIWRRVAGGCHLDRPHDRLIEGAGFRIERIRHGRLLPGPALLGWHQLGLATVR
ncbi:class I SAM-dependent methyltransferase [Geminicoccus roseus]|uniref:class I SAM-dependent methyltransferase n=1 Tax=Geminicoccus roseus TaxID=404900 RepID=UPI000413C0F6|nr:class I SAM-dependent methyltransferase [Geminicoccus roseus]